MNRLPYYVLTYYDKSVVKRIVVKFDMGPNEAAMAFLTSETHAMLEDAELSIWDSSELAIFDMWEVEQVTGDPRNSVYLRGVA